ncbi:MAG: sodium/pantothenate symporter [Clostridia bacterium]|nr:sodium/pantothenate symporter [Clostridia bacterium]
MTQTQSTLLVIFIAYLLLNTVIGLWYSRKKNSEAGTDEKKFFIGGRGMNGLILAMTIMATYTSASSFLSGPGAAGMTYGYAQVWVAAVQVPVTFLVLGVLGNKLAIVSRRTGAVTVVGYLKARYKSDTLVITVSLLMVVFVIAQMIGQFSGGATLIASITGLEHVPALLIFGAVVVIYTAFGGFSAVAITDTIQGIIMCVGTFLFLFFVLQRGGGVSGIDAGLRASSIADTYANLNAVYSNGGLLSYWVLVGFATLGLPQTAVRAMGFKNTKSMHSAMWIGAVTCSFVIVGMHLAGCWAGGLGIALPEGTSSDGFIPYVIQQIMPTGVAGIFLAAPMAAVMSTADSLLILVAAAIVRDLYRTYVVREDKKKLESYHRNVKKMSTVCTIVLGALVILLTVNPPDIIFFINMFAFGGLECTFLWPLLGGLFWKKGTRQAAVAGSIGSVGLYIFFWALNRYAGFSIAGFNPVIWGLLGGGILYFAVGHATAKKGLDPDILDKCF